MVDPTKNERYMEMYVDKESLFKTMTGECQFWRAARQQTLRKSKINSIRIKLNGIFQFYDYSYVQ